MRIMLACGGTGGHIFPAIAIAEELVRRNKKTKIVFAGSDNGMEREIMLKHGFKYAEVTARPFARRIFFKNITNLFLNIKAVFAAKKIVKEFNPDFVIGTGGFVSFPVVFAAALLKKRTLIHEPNMVPGIANRMLSVFVNFITVGFEETLKYFPRKKTIVVGNPVRPGIKGKSKKAGLAVFSLSPSNKTVLVMPGSRAAHKINETLILAIGAMEKELKGIQILWMCGKADLKEVKKAAAGHKKIQIKAFDFIHDVDSAYAASDAGIMRAGASTLSEIAALKFPAILVPYPYATDNHQEKNAAVFEKMQAGLIIKDRDLTPETVVTALKKILDKKENNLIRKKLKSMYKGNGAKKITDIIYHLSLASSGLERV